MPSVVGGVGGVCRVVVVVVVIATVDSAGFVSEVTVENLFRKFL